MVVYFNGYDYDCLFYEQAGEMRQDYINSTPLTGVFL